MIGNFGWRGVLLNSVDANRKYQNTIPSSGGGISFASVNSVEYITGEIICGNLINKETLTAKPLNANIKNYPIAGEIVMLVQIPKVNATLKNGYGPKSQDNFVRYISGINIWDNPSLNALNESTQITVPNDSSHFSPTKIQNIIPLTSSPGDIIVEGRFGNSIRLGNTNPNFPNDYSSNGETGDPITIINNGQNGNVGFDLSSIYLTSYQQIANFKIANNAFSSFKEKPTYADQYVSPQIILNSTRVILNANSDSVLISGEKSVSLSSNESINLESEKIYMQGIDIKLGSKNASEPVLLGDKTVDLLVDIAAAVRKLSMVVSTLKIYPGGVAAPDPANAIGHEMYEDMGNTVKKLMDRTHGIRSNFVKTR